MPGVRLARSADGPALDLTIGLSASAVQSMRSAGRPVPSPWRARALLDTGADLTCLDPTALAPLIGAGIPPARYVFSNLPAAGGLIPSAVYAVRLMLQHPSGRPTQALDIRTLMVVERAIGAAGIEALLGRDVLDRCLLIYDGPAGDFTLQW